MKHSRKLALFFSLMPGAGHMYLGLIRQGIQLMLLFFFTFFISMSYQLEILLVFTPVIWFYSIFDVRTKSLQENPLVDGDLPIFSNKNLMKTLSKDSSIEKYIAYCLILMGFFSLIDNLLVPLLERYLHNYEFIRYAKSFIISIILITIGILLIKRKNKALPDIKSGDN